MVKENIKSNTQIFDEMFYCSAEELQRQIDEEMKEEGLKEGLREGLKEGAKQNSIEIAKKMIKEKFDTETIIKLTGLTKEEIKDMFE